VRGERCLPVLLEAGPLPVGVEARPGAIERVRVAEAAAADAGAADDRHVLEQRQAEDAVQAQPRGEEVAADVPRRARELVVGIAPARLDDDDAVALLGQPVRRDAAAEARADDEPVVVVIASRRRHGAARLGERDGGVNID
jgi:hypothetical protein